MHRYYLKHRNDICAVLDIEENSWSVDNAKLINQEIAPYAGNATDASIKTWWSMRAVPSTRKTMEELVRSSGCSSNEEYLAKNLALSVTDAYWICPINSDLKWEDVNIPVLSAYNEGKMPYHNATSYDKNAALSGQMDKYWDLNENPPVLVKNAYIYHGQQAINEFFATYLHDSQKTDIPYVKYSIRENKDRGCIESRCPSFVSGNLEFVSAYEIMHLVSRKNSESLYETYISECEKRGIPETVMRDFMDYQTLSDFVITNTDEHLNNFGILRDIDTLRFVSPAPIFDSGNSMFYTESEAARPLKRYEILQREISSFHKTEDKMISHVQNRMLVDIGKLPVYDDVIKIYMSNGISEKKSILIAENYNRKVEMLRDFQQGAKISLYHEKTRDT